MPAAQLLRAVSISALTREWTPLVVWPVCKSLSITAWKRSTSPAQPDPVGMRKVLGVTPVGACSGEGAGGGAAVWQAARERPRAAAKKATRISGAPAGRTGTMVDSIREAKVPDGRDLIAQS
ncbi:hypothetical protein BOS5A_110034 [Bosea sp. EC-HK365B]|nr:hypothetical protein BOS5A_110034 [Bosea sp. EC-HK365B]VXA99913.1 hypothetical protein BOSE127_10175 [Bosea sp. 127]